MTLTYLTLQKGIRILKMTHQRNGWSPVTGNKRTAPIYSYCPGSCDNKFCFQFYFAEVIKGIYCQPAGSKRQQYASKQVIIATQKCFLCLGTPVILRKHSFAGSVSVLAFLKSLIMTNKAFLLRLYQRSSGSFKHFCSLVSAHGIRFVCICYQI